MHFAIRVEAPPTPTTVYSEQDEHVDDEEIRHQALVRASVFSNFIFSMLTFLGVLGLLGGAIFYALRFTNIYLLMEETKTHALVVEMAKAVRFSRSSISCDYENFVELDWRDSPYPPAFGNTDVKQLSAKLKTLEEAERMRKSAKSATSKTKTKTKNDDEDENKQIKCPIAKGTLQKSDKVSLKDLPKNNVTVYKISNCTMDRKDEADAFVGTIAMMARLKAVAGIPTIVDLFEESGAVYCAVAPPLVDRLDDIQFRDGESAMTALRQLMEIIHKVHQKGVVLLNVTTRTVFMHRNPPDSSDATPLIEPPSQPVLIEDPVTGMFTLPRGMIVPKLKRTLEAGGKYHKSVDFYMALKAFYSLHSPELPSVVRQQIRKCKDLFTVGTKSQYAQVGVDKIRQCLGVTTSQSVINYTISAKRNFQLSSFTPPSDSPKTSSNNENQYDHDGDDDDDDDGGFEEKCAIPVYDHILDMFRRQPNSRMDSFL